MPRLLILPRETVRTPYHYKSGECVPYAARGVLSSEADWEAALSGAVRRDLIFIYPESGELCRCQCPVVSVYK